jgi:hypothetical protein
MKRVASNVTVALCLLAALLSAALWARGLSVRDEIVVHAAGRKWIVSTFPHHLFVLGHTDPGPWRAESYELGMTQYPAAPRYWELRYEADVNGLVRIGIPFWLLVLVATGPPAYSCLRRFRDLRWRHRGLCRACGYDLRASRDRCPECGMAIPEAVPSAAPSLT